MACSRDMECLWRIQTNIFVDSLVSETGPFVRSFVLFSHCFSSFHDPRKHISEPNGTLRYHQTIISSSIIPTLSYLSYATFSSDIDCPHHNMILAYSVLVSLLGSTALALPTNHTNTTLTKRRHNPWLGGFTSSDCSGSVMAGDVQNLDDGSTGQTCYVWSPPAGATYIGINFGGDGDPMDAVRWSEDTQCTKSKQEHDYVHQGGDDSGMSCVAVSAYPSIKAFKSFADPGFNNQYWSPSK